MLPCAQSPWRLAPLRCQRIVRAPGLVALGDAGTPVPPSTPDLSPALGRREWITRVHLEHIQFVLVAIRGAQRIRADPGFDAGSTERRIDQAHRHVDGLLEFTGEVEAGRREITQRVGAYGLPLRGSLEGLQRNHATGLRHGQQPDRRAGRAGDLGTCIQRAPDWQLHVRLARTQPHIADQYVADRLCPRTSARSQRIRPSRPKWGQLRFPSSLAVGARELVHVTERDAHLLARLRAPPYPDRLVALQYRVVLEHGVK